jgi:hypothetical protein
MEMWNRVGLELEALLQLQLQQRRCLWSMARACRAGELGPFPQVLWSAGQRSSGPSSGIAAECWSHPVILEQGHGYAGR